MNPTSPLQEKCSENSVSSLFWEIRRQEKDYKTSLFVKDHLYIGFFLGGGGG